MRPRLIFFLVVAIGCAVEAYSYREYLIDDSFISLRYAQNLAEGHGLVWNLGERVEGYTNTLWVLIGALSFWVGFDPVAVLRVFSLCSALAAIAAVVALAKLITRSAEQRLPGELAVLWLLSCESFAYYATTTMETMLFTALAACSVTVCAWESYSKRRLGSLPLFVLLVCTRPEGALFFALSHVGFIVVEKLRCQMIAWRRHFGDAVVLGAFVAGYCWWRFGYYGDFLPNTYRAKVTGGIEQVLNGGVELGRWAVSHPVFALVMCLPLGLLIVDRDWWRQRPVVGALWFITLCWLLYTVAVGGDSMPLHRFILPVFPLMAVLTWALFDEIGRRSFPGVSRSRLVLASGLLMLSQGVAGRLSEESVRAFVAHQTTSVGHETGRYLASRYEADDLLAVNTAGALPYSSGLRALDMLGLTDREIAESSVFVTSLRWSGHRRGCGACVMERMPAVIVWYNSTGSREPHYLGDRQLADDPYFRFFFQLQRTVIPQTANDGGFSARLWGAPFGLGRQLLPDLGFRAEVVDSPLQFTRIRPLDITFWYFARRQLLDELWPARTQYRDDLGSFLDRAVVVWSRRSVTVDSEARRTVDNLCQRAARAAQSGESELAKELLSQAARLNGAAQSPLVGHYIANLAIAEQNLFLAVQGQLEALRLAPSESLYRTNLEYLLTVSYDRFMEKEAT